MVSVGIKSAPEPTLRRLPYYHHYLLELQQRGREVVSCTHIATDLRLDPTQVRKDLAVTGIVGRPKVGYDVPALIHAIESFLDWDNLTDAFLVGVGHLGTALLGYHNFGQYGLHLVAAFDSDPQKVGTTVHGKAVLPIEKLSNLAKRMHIHLGVLAVPASAAQETADLMVASGIRAIWNFAPTTLNLPGDIIVENENLASTLAVLSRKLAQKLKASM